MGQLASVAKKSVNFVVVYCHQPLRQRNFSFKVFIINGQSPERRTQGITLFLLSSFGLISLVGDCLHRIYQYVLAANKALTIPQTHQRA